MGTGQSARRDSFDVNGDGHSGSGRTSQPFAEAVGFDHFHILRAIGKGSFGKVCIVQKKDTKTMFAMKYMNKAVCAEKDALRNVFREVALLRRLEHAFIVNLWYTFEDEEDMFMVVDLLLGGDLRYHIQQEVAFSERQVSLYVCETALALDYLRAQNVLHRDVKPDNLLLDEEGHIHLTDFNVATLLNDGKLATSLTGTKPYMAPEIFTSALDEGSGYSFPVDWWALGVCAYEILRGKRPHDVALNASLSDTRTALCATPVNYPVSWSDSTRNLLHKMLAVDPAHRLSSLADLKTHSSMENFDFDKVLQRQVKPSFIPAKDHLNCDPMYELEEMIIEAKPLHKKKKRLAKQNSKKDKQTAADNETNETNTQHTDFAEFKCYNRQRDLDKRKSRAAAGDNEKTTAETIRTKEVSQPEERENNSQTSNNKMTNVQT